MRELHVVDPVESGRVVLATADDAERFELVVDQTLRDALTAFTASAADPAAPEITPREIQVRVRAGESPQDIAMSHGAAISWVQRFAEPVLAERRRVADEARRAKARRSTTDGQTVIFGEAVDDRFAQHGIEPQTVRWDAHRGGDGQWAIVARWIGGQSEHTAEWALQLGTRTVSPVDDTAADLLSDRPIRPLTAPEQPTDVDPSAPPLVPGLVAFPAMPDAHTGPLPRAEEVFDRTGSDAGFDAGLEARFDAVLPIDVPEAETTARMPSVRNLGVASRPGETEEEKAARASVPSWDDILLGVRRKRD